MKKLIFAFLMLPLCAMAQEEGEPVVVCDTLGTVIEPVQMPRFGVIDYDGVLAMMPEYKAAQEEVAKLKAKYDAESERAESEFQRKFAEFLDGQKDFPQNIMEKRQKELQTLLEQSVQFRQSAQKLLRQAEADYTANARRRLDAVLQQVAADEGLLFIFNSSSNQIPFVDQQRVLDVEELVTAALGL